MDYDIKEQFLIKTYGRRISTRLFDETDLFSFLILVREHLNSQFSYIRDIADLIAHRHRDRGIASKAISAAIKNGYEVEADSKHVMGYNGIESGKWRIEWKQLGEKIGFPLSNQAVREISLCVISILQFSSYEDKDGHHATIFLIQSDDGQLSACTLEDGKTQPYINFFSINGLQFKKLYRSRLIDDPVIVVRNEKGEAILQNCHGDRIV